MCGIIALVGHRSKVTEKNTEEALDEMVMVAEGVRAARMFGTRSRDLDLKTPFIEVVNDLLDGKINAEECCRQIAVLA